MENQKGKTEQVSQMGRTENEKQEAYAVRS